MDDRSLNRHGYTRLAGSRPHIQNHLHGVAGDDALRYAHIDLERPCDGAGAPVAEITVAFTPPIDAVTGERGLGSGSLAIDPSTPAGWV